MACGSTKTSQARLTVMSTPVTTTALRPLARLGATVGALALLLTAGCAVPVAEPYGYGPDYGYYDYGYGPAYPAVPYVIPAPSTSIVLEGGYWSGGPRWREPPPLRPGRPRPPWAHPRPPEGHAPGPRPPQARSPDGHWGPPPARAQGQAGPRGPWQGRPHQRDSGGDRPQRGERGR